MEDDLQGGGDNIVTEFATYEDFLDSQASWVYQQFNMFMYQLYYVSSGWIELSLP